MSPRNRSGWIITKVLEHEGGYVWDERDPGGETNYGISRKFLDSVGRSDDLTEGVFTRETAIEIYRTHFWKSYMEHIDGDIICLMLFDFGVNAGLDRAVKTLQKSLRIKEDGQVGPITLSRTNAPGQQRWIVKRFFEEIILFYGNLSNFQYFGKSWVRRAVDNIFHNGDFL